MPKSNSELTLRLAGVRQRIIWTSTAALLLTALGGACLVLILISLFFLSGWVLMVVPLGIMVLARFWFRATDLKSIGYRVERRFPELRGRLVAALELIFYRPGAEGYSLELRDAAVQQVSTIAAPLNFNSVVSRKRLWWSGFFALVGLVMLGCFLGFGRTRAELGLINAFNPKKILFRFSVMPGDTSLLTGEVVTVGCSVEPASGFNSIILELKEMGARQTESRRIKLIQGRGVFPVVVQKGFFYRFRLLGRNSPWYSIRVPTPLGLKNLVFTAYPPSYTGLKPLRLSGTELTLLRGTRVELSAQASAPINQGQMILGAETLPLTIEQERFTASFTVRQDAEGMVNLASDPGRLIPVYRFNLRALSDEPPFVKVFLPGRDIDLPLNMQVPLGINSIDDFGLSALWLHYGKETLNQAICIRRLSGLREDTTFYLWDLSGINLLPGEQLRYYVRAVDNDLTLGPKSSRTEIFTVRFPTMTEIYDQAVGQTAHTIDQLEPLKSEQAKLGTELSRITQEMKKRRELSWEEQKQLERIAREQLDLLNQIDQLQQQIAQTTDELLEGMNWDQETLKRLDELGQLLSRLIPEELQQALKELSEKLKQPGGNFSDLLERLKTEQERLKGEIEQALKLLNRIMEEVRLEALQRQAAELAHEQEELTRALKLTEPESLVEKQQAINAGFDSLHQELKELGQNFSEPSVAESLNQLASRMDEEKIGELARTLQKQLRTGMRSEAQKTGEQLTRSFRQLAEQLDRLSDELKKSRSQEIVRQIFTHTTALVTISENQERLETELRTGSAPASISNQQQSILEATRMIAESIAGLGSRTMSIPPQLSQELARAMNLMSTVSHNASTGNHFGLLDGMRQARQSLNQAIALLLQAGAQARQGGGLAGGLQNLLEQLSQMTSEQMAINVGMSGLPIPIPGSGLNPQQLQQLMELLARQQALRQQLEQLLKSMGGERPGLTGALEPLVEEMKAIERALSELQVDRKLIERQQGIVSRLLDTQRSLRQQGFKEQREAQTARSYEPHTPPALPADLGERNRLLREELMRALKQGYPAEYEPLIRAYFESLLHQAP